MEKIFEFAYYGGLAGFIIMRIFLYDYKGIMFAFAGLGLIGFIGKKIIKSKQASISS